jgi:hypothetical protein
LKRVDNDPAVLTFHQVALKLCTKVLAQFTVHIIRKGRQQLTAVLVTVYMFILAVVFFVHSNFSP